MFNLGVKRKEKLEVVFYNFHFEEFISKSNDFVKKKIFWVLDLVSDLQRIPETYFKQVNPTYKIYEIRVRVSGNSIRIFCFFDKNQRLIVLNCFQKKTQKTPEKEIEKAIKLKKQYESEKDRPGKS